MFTDALVGRPWHAFRFGQRQDGENGDKVQTKIDGERMIVIGVVATVYRIMCLPRRRASSARLITADLLSAMAVDIDGYVRSTAVIHIDKILNLLS